MIFITYLEHLIKFVCIYLKKNIILADICVNFVL